MSLSVFCAGVAIAVRKHFFFEKKKKTFGSRVAPFESGVDQDSKVFWFFFSKKNFLLTYLTLVL